MMVDRNPTTDDMPQQYPTEEEAQGKCHLKVLNLQDSAIVTLSPSIDRFFPNLEELDVSYTIHLSRLPEQIGNITNLTKLNLKHSEIESLPPSIGRLQNLRDLNLAVTGSLSFLPDEIGNLVNLQSLDLHFSAIGSLPRSIGELTNLKHLDLSGTRRLSDLPEAIGNLVRLRTLVLRKSAIGSVPACVGNLRNLESLDLSCTEGFSVLPDTIGDLLRLRKLNLEHSEITVLPPSIGKLKDHHLRDLDLSFTKISSLPNEIGKFVGLKLNLQHCERISTLQLPTASLSSSLSSTVPPEDGLAVEQHWNIGELDISFTGIQHVPEAIGHHMAKNLTKLVMHDTDISSLPSSIGCLQMLDHLDLSRTPNLVNLPTELGDLSRLTSLKLRASAIRELPPSIGRLGNLENLDLSCAAVDLTSLPVEIGKLASLNRLDLQQSSGIRSLPSSMVRLKNLRDLNVSGCTKILSDPPSIEVLGKIYSLTKLCLGRQQRPQNNKISPSVAQSAKNIWYSLVCHKVQSRLLLEIEIQNARTDIPTTRSPELWPFLLSKASNLFQKSSPKISNYDFSLSGPEAIYQLLQNGRESFLQTIPQ